MKPVLLDLFCCAGGATYGYQQAGFRVVGVDRKYHENYCGDEFILADAFDVLDDLLLYGIWRYDAIHASPPCQFGTAYKRRPNWVKDSPNLLPPVRAALRETGLPYVIENLWAVSNLMVDPVRYCGSSFGLDIQRHRAFEANWPLTGLPCDHSWQTPRFPQATNRGGLRRTVEIGVGRVPIEEQRRAMGIDWMVRSELTEAIPPAYSQHIGEQLMGHIKGGQSWKTKS